MQENSAQKEVDDLIQEMKIMQEIGSHPHVVTILGVCTEQGENYYLASSLSNPASEVTSWPNSELDQIFHAGVKDC